MRNTQTLFYKKGSGEVAINKIHVRNFTVFEELEMAFANGVNVLIGTNGTGKTHLLKSMYAICEGLRSNNKTGYEVAQPYFSVDALNLMKDKEDLVKAATVDVEFVKDIQASYSIRQNTKTMPENFIYNRKQTKIKSIFIPAKEMLSHSKGFLALNNKYEIPFDKTYVDILTNAELPETREVSSLNETLLTKLSKVIDGQVTHENGKFYVVKTNGNKVEFPIEAEGFRKFGLLWKLIRNGLLEEGTVLFWDEPEANINPEILPVLVEVLLELQRKGVQIFIATHSYNLAKYFEVKRSDTDEVLYHHLFKTERGVKVESNTYFGELTNNPIINADAKLLDEVIEGNFDD